MQLSKFGLSCASALILLLGLLFSASCHAQNDRKLHFIRDAEIESDLRAMATPLLQAAAINPNSVSIALIQDNNINAFVAGGMNIFVHTGLLQASDDAGQLVGVLAHEIGHIAGGHLVRGAEAGKYASAQAILGVVLGVAAGVAAKDSRAAAGIISGSQAVAARNFFSFSRTQESSADAAALTYLDNTNFSSKGMLTFLEKLAGQELMPYERQSEFVQTHPLTMDRVDTVRQHVASSKFSDAPIPTDYVRMHERIKAKLLGFLTPETALLRYTDKDARIPARYARCIALYRTNQLERALPMIDGLIKEEPNNPFFHELRGQMLYENSRVDEAVAAYAKSVALLPESSLLRVAYAQSLLESKTDKKENLDQAIEQLQEAARLDSRDSGTWRLLATAWGRKGDAAGTDSHNGLVTYALAEEAAARGADEEAAKLAKRAVETLPKSSPYWLRAQDIRISLEKTTEGKD